MAEDGAEAGTAAGDATNITGSPAGPAPVPGVGDRSAEELLADAASATDEDIAKGDDTAAQLAALQKQNATLQKHYRTWEARAKENSAAAARLAEIEEASKTESQKLADRAAAAEQRLAESDARYHRTMAAATYGLPPALMASITGTTEDEANASAEALAAAFNGAVEQAAQLRAGELAAALTTGQAPAPARGQRPVEAMRAGALPAGATVPANANDWIRAAFQRG